MEQTAEQVAQQVAQAVGETIRQASAETTRAVIDATRTAASQEVGAEREMETGTDEYFKHQSQMNALNSKRTYDEYQQESLESIKRNRTHIDKILSDAQQYDNGKANIANQALQNAVETANILAKNALVNLDALQKQHTAHRDIASDNLWNPIQQGAADATTIRAVTIDDASLKAIGAVVAAAVAEALTKK